MRTVVASGKNLSLGVGDRLRPRTFRKLYFTCGRARRRRYQTEQLQLISPHRCNGQYVTSEALVSRSSD